jgi:hypothetical protein
MAERLYADVTGSNQDEIVSLNLQTGHNMATAALTLNVTDTTLDIGDTVEANFGYVSNHRRLFSGYVKQIERSAESGIYSITANDVMVRAIDFFVVSADPDTPFKRSHISAEDLVKDVLALAQLTSYDFDPTLFTFAIRNPAEVNLTSSHDYCRMIADILYWHLYADKDGVCHFVDRKPYVDGDIPLKTLTDYEISSFTHRISEKDLRNRVVVYGAGSIHAEASAPSPYLPAGYYKTAVCAAPVIDDQTMANQAAAYNLPLYNRLTESVSLNLIGDPDIEARCVVTLNEAVLGVTGDWYVYTAVHNWGDSGYAMGLELRK